MLARSSGWKVRGKDDAVGIALTGCGISRVAGKLGRGGFDTGLRRRVTRQRVAPGERRRSPCRGDSAFLLQRM
jgi:hypothetical protein